MEASHDKRVISNFQRWVCWWSWSATGDNDEWVLYGSWGDNVLHIGRMSGDKKLIGERER